MTDRTHPGEVPGVEEGGRPAVRSDGGMGGELFDAMPDPAVRYVVGRDHARVVEVNTAYVSDFGVDPGVGGPLETRLRTDLERNPPGEGLARVDDVVELVESAGEGDHIRTVVRATTASGERDYLARVVPLSDDGDGYLVLTDITTQRERTRDLIEQRDRLDEFASIVSHDLRNPLEVAKIQLEAARNRGDAVHFRKVDEAHERMERIIGDVLTLARQGQVIDEVGEAALSMVAADAWDTVSAPAATMEVADDAVLEADDDRLQELLENLFRNAREHGGPEVTVTVGTLDDGFYVADDGPGIPPGDRETVFDGGYSTNDDGTGLGLVIVERIAEAHGWDVSVTESAAGGARFEFSRVGLRP
jgi:signal transduction histidine kinase